MSSPAVCSILYIVPLFILVASTHAAKFTITNKCQFTAWAQPWSIEVPAGTTGGRMWAHTCCNFDGSGNGQRQTGDCGGVLQCAGYGQAPNTLAEFGLNGFSNLDFFDIFVIDGFNVPMDFLPTDGTVGCAKGGPRCDTDITAQCPSELQAPGGCNNACTVFKKDEYCYTGTAADNCGPTDYSKFFKGRCPDAYNYPKDDPSSTFTCPGGTNYQVVFCS